MKRFLTYTLARLGLFLAVYGVVWLVVSRTIGWDVVTALYTALIAVVMSSLLSLVLLRRQRAALAADLAERSQRSAQGQHGSVQRRDDKAGEDAGGVTEFRQTGVSEDRNER